MEATVFRKDCAKAIEPMGMPRCQAPVVISEGDPRSKERACWSSSVWEGKSDKELGW